MKRLTVVETTVEFNHQCASVDSLYKTGQTGLFSLLLPVWVIRLMYGLPLSGFMVACVLCSIMDRCYQYGVDVTLIKHAEAQHQWYGMGIKGSRCTYKSLQR